MHFIQSRGRGPFLKEHDVLAAVELDCDGQTVAYLPHTR